MATATRTFDCPWCGAIAPVPSDHLGEHLICTECGKATKLTAKNTSNLGPTETPPDAPHLTGDRTFDCPWCGAISGVPSSHLGDRFACPECLKATKLTPTNTQRSPVTAPPPEAPHIEAGVGRGVWIGLGVLAAAAIGAFAFLMPSGGGEKVPTPTAPAGATVGDAGRGAAAPAPIAPPSPAPQPETPIAPSPATAPAAPVDDGAGARALAAIADAAQRVAAAGETHQKALAAIADWTSQHAGALDALADLSVLEQAVTEAERLRIDPKLFPEPAKATPEQVRAYDTAMVGVLSAAPGGARVGERALTFLRGDLYGREVAGVTSWQGIHFYGPGFQRAASTMLAADKAVAAPVPPSLVEAEASARKGLAEAQASLDAARATPASKDAPAPTVPTATDPK